MPPCMASARRFATGRPNVPTSAAKSARQRSRTRSGTRWKPLIGAATCSRSAGHSWISGRAIARLRRRTRSSRSHDRRLARTHKSAQKDCHPILWGGFRCARVPSFSPPPHCPKSSDRCFTRRPPRRLGDGAGPPEPHGREHSRIGTAHTGDRWKAAARVAEGPQAGTTQNRRDNCPSARAIAGAAGRLGRHEAQGPPSARERGSPGEARRGPGETRSPRGTGYARHMDFDRLQ
jgi:hypothetical protein